MVADLALENRQLRHALRAQGPFMQRKPKGDGGKGTPEKCHAAVLQEGKRPPFPHVQL